VGPGVHEPVPADDREANDGCGAGEDRGRLTRWRLVLGGSDGDGIGEAVTLNADADKRDQVLRDLYEGSRGGLAGLPGEHIVTKGSSR
jgi:hypothetical protein